MVNTVKVGEQTPTVTFTAALDGKLVNAGWSLNKGEIGTIPQAPSALPTLPVSHTRSRRAASAF